MFAAIETRLNGPKRTFQIRFGQRQSQGRRSVARLEAGLLTYPSDSCRLGGTFTYHTDLDDSFGNDRKLFSWACPISVEVLFGRKDRGILG